MKKVIISVICIMIMSVLTLLGCAAGENPGKGNKAQSVYVNPNAERKQAAPVKGNITVSSKRSEIIKLKMDLMKAEQTPKALAVKE